MSGIDDGCNARIRTAFPVPFGDNTFSTMFVCANGLICFGRRYESYTVPSNKEFSSDLINVYCLAPYFTDMDLSYSGKVWYKAYDSDTDVNITSSMTALVYDTYEVSIEPLFIFKATWEETPKYNGNSNERVTFQAVYITDGEVAYTFYFYQPGGMNFQLGSQFIGFLINGLADGLDDRVDGAYLRNADDNLNLTLEASATVTVYRGAASFELTPQEGLGPNYPAMCKKWHKGEIPNRSYYRAQLNSMPICPCTSSFLFFDSQFGSGSFDFNTGVMTVPVRPRRQYAPYGKTCAYDMWFGGFIGWGRRAGSFETYNQLTNSYMHEQEDASYKRICCEQSDLCDLYYEVRPRVESCDFTFSFFFAGGFGDPHITTLDGRKYTFNGHGEYILLNMSSADVDIQIQSRTAQAVKEDGSLSEATIFSAFVIQTADSWLQVEINNDKSGINLYAGTNNTHWADYTVDFYSNGSNSTSVTEELTFSRDNNTLVTSFSESAIAFNVTIGLGLLQMSLGLPSTYQNKTTGLLGNFNGKSTDDFLPRMESNPLPDSSNESEIFTDFGQTWMTTADESLFKYDNGMSHADFSFPHFVPKFLDEANETLVAEAKELCGEGNNQCIFDYVFTGNPELAMQTNTTEALADETVARTSNGVPVLNVSSGTELVDGRHYINLNINEPSSFTLLGIDDGDLSYELVNTTANVVLGTPNVDGTVAVDLSVNDANPVYVSVTAKDDYGVNSPPLDVVIVLCTGCSSHGECNTGVIREDVRATDNFKYASCICEQYWTGDDCETDFNACEANPCSVGRNCTDTLAEEHKDDPNLPTYKCSPCPAGYNDTGVKCEDFDECSDGTPSCNQVCVNTEGSYYCQCHQGYRLSDNDVSCQDINECDESTSGCDQICTNLPGNFSCSCYEGFTYNTLQSKCEQDEAPPAGCDILDCSNADGCTTNGNSSVCFCSSGYQLTSGDTCTDIDECATGVCSQSCVDTAGSFNCGCFTGYKLLEDHTTCEPCTFPNFGEDCANTCHCGRGSLRCDPVHGCICKEGWTGTNCNSEIDECLVTNVCEDADKICSNTIGSYRCNCRSGYKLENGICIDNNECNDPSLNVCEQQCTNNIGSFSCSCNAGYSIDPENANECRDIDECSTGASDCEHICRNADGRYSCECYFGFLLNDDRKTCSKVSDPCTLFPHVNCSDICLVVDQQAECSCNTGYTLGADDQTCIDINECDENLDLNQCSEKESCNNLIGGYSCSCSPGYKLENDQRTCTACDSSHYGVNCAKTCDCGVGANRCDPVNGCDCRPGWTGDTCGVDVDECASSPCPGNNIQCINNPGSYECNCEAGYTNETGICQDVDECVSLNDCAQLCTNTNGSYQCSCERGFLQDGNECNDINECEGQNECSQVCSNTLGSYRCSCNQGFKLDLSDRRACIPEELCTTNPCSNNAQCTSVNGTATCVCNSGFEFETGSNKTCVDIKECSATPSPCSQGCTEAEGTYHCVCSETGYQLAGDMKTCVECPDGKYGNNCTEICSCNEINTDSCNHVNGTCTCKEGWEGETCEEDIDECITTHPCPEHSKCLNTDGSFRCQCDVGFLTTNNASCQECVQGTFGTDCSSTCTCNTQNVQSCNTTNGTCTCKDGWEGENCSVDIDECDRNTYKCPDDSTCENTDGSYDCSCNGGFVKTNGTCRECDGFSFGKDCVTDCTCNFNNAHRCDHLTGKCVCKDGWQGEYCVTDVDECSRENENPCTESHKSKCENNVGSYLCQCDDGFELYSNGTCIDIDECETNAHNCSDSQRCNNTIGSFNCPCDVGYSGTQKDCTPCANGTWGEQCVNECFCDQEYSTGDCDNKTGCVCKTGWQGVNCTEDIDECDDPATCVENSYCNNTLGSHTCTCYSGYKTQVNECQKCSVNNYGVECDTSCNCVANNTIDPSQSCDHINGTCYCTPYWEGSRCETDINECELGTHNCSKDHEGCHNEDGGFKCSCLIGYVRNNETKECVEDAATDAPPTAVPVGSKEVNVVLTLNINVTGNLTVSITYDSYVKEVKRQLTSIYNEQLSGAEFKIFINSLKTGSLIVYYTVVVSESEMSSVAAANAKIASGITTVTIFNITAEIITMSINGTSVTVGGAFTDEILCELYEASVGPCSSDDICTVSDGLPVCKLREVEDNLSLILGLGLGVPMFLLVVAVIVLGVVLYRYKVKSRKEHSFQSDFDDKSGSVFSGRMPLRMNTRNPSGPYRMAPDLAQYRGQDDMPQYRSQDNFPQFRGQDDFPQYRGQDMSTIYQREDSTVVQSREGYRREDSTIVQSREGYRPYKRPNQDAGEQGNFTWDYILDNIPSQFRIDRPEVDEEPLSVHLKRQRNP